MTTLPESSESVNESPKWSPESLTPIHLELLISNVPVPIYDRLAKLAPRTSNDGSEVSFMTAPGDLPFFYLRYLSLPLNYYLLPYVLVDPELQKGPILEVSRGKSMKKAYYVLVGHSEVSVANSITYDELVEKLMASKPADIAEHKIYTFKRRQESYIQIGDDGQSDNPMIEDDDRLPAEFKEMAEALNLSDYYPAKDSLLVQRGYDFVFNEVPPAMPQYVGLPTDVSGKLQKIFVEKEYMDADRIIHSVKSQIEKNYKDSKIKADDTKFGAFFSTICHMLQSSGYGKSKTTWELGKHVPLIYSSLMDGDGFPRPTLLFKMLLSKCKFLSGRLYADIGCGIVYSFLCRLFFIILSSPMATKDGPRERFSCDECVLSYFEKGSIKLEELFDSIFKGLEMLEGVIIDLDKPINLQQSFKWIVNGTVKLETDDLEKDLRRIVSEFRERFNSQECPLIFVVDEAQALLYEKKSNQKTNPNTWTFLDEEVRAFNIFRRVFRYFLLFWDDIWPLFLSTNGKISNFLTDIAKDDSRRPVKNNAIVPPIELVQTFGVNLKKVDKDNWRDYLMNPDRISDMYKCGRPLIHDSFISEYGDAKFDNNLLNTPYRSCLEIDYLRGKIFSDFSDSGPITTFKNPDDTTKFTILGLSVAFDSFPRDVNVDEMVASHMMTLLRYDHKIEKLFGVFPPEGVLNGIASWFLVYYCGAYLLLLMTMMPSSLMNVGVLGETLAKINLVHASIKANGNNTSDPFDEPIRKQISAPVDFQAYLECLTGDSGIAKAYLEANPGLKGSLLGFSYFHRWQDHIEDPQDLLKTCLIRGCGIHLMDNYPSIDLLLPLVLADGRLSFVAIQVKLWRGESLSKTSSAQIQALHQICGYKNLFPKAPTVSDPPPYAILLINLYNKNGTDKLEFTISSFKNKKEELKKKLAKSCKNELEKIKKEITDPSLVDKVLEEVLNSLTEEILKIPDMLFINGAFSDSMSIENRAAAALMASTQLPITKYMNGLEKVDILVKRDLLSLYYGKGLFKFLSESSPVSELSKRMNEALKIEEDSEESKDEASSSVTTTKTAPKRGRKK